MCGRFVQATCAKELSERTDLPSGSLFDRPRFNVAPTTPIAAIRESRNGGRELVALKWGLILRGRGTARDSSTLSNL